jgi:hypothetical protein
MRAILTGLTFLIALSAARADVVERVPMGEPTPGVALVATTGWRLSAVIRVDVEGTKRVLIIEGDVINATDSQRESPTIRFGLRDDGGREYFHWTVKVAEPHIAARDFVAFETRLENPPGDTDKVEIRTVDGD